MKRKVLLMGKSGSGKTSMRSIIFANYLARDTMRLGPTLGVENSHVRFLGNLILNLWDCGGQDAFMENYFESQRDQIFRNVEVLIYVFDASSREEDRDMDYFESCVTAIRQNSKNAHIFTLVHKMDLLGEQEKEQVAGRLSDRVAEISEGLSLTVFRTSIWDETLYKAWSSIVYALVPNVRELEAQLDKFCGLCEADEVVLFEKATFLVISHATHVEHRDVHRFEKISNIIKQFKLSCSKSSSTLESIVLRSHFTAFITSFTETTFVMLITSNGDIQPAAVELNLAAARRHFEDMVGMYAGNG